MIRDPLLRKAVIAASVCGMLTVFVALLASTVRYEPFGVPEFKRAEVKQRQAEARQKVADVQRAIASGIYPGVEIVGESVYQFGLADPHATISHAFTIKNIGNAPLTLQAGDTSCKCTLSKVDSEFVDPGETASVTLTFNTGRKREYYRQYAVIKTNDPGRPEIELAVEGRVRRELAISPQEVVLDTVAGEAVEQVIEVYSELWSAFEIGQLKTDLNGLSWTLAEMPASRLAELDAKSGWSLKLKLRGDQPRGYYSGLLSGQVIAVGNAEDDLTQLVAVADKASTETAEKHGSHATEKKSEHRFGEGSEPVSIPRERLLEIPVRGKIIAPLTFHGPNLHRDEGFRIGVLTGGKSHVFKAFIQNRGQREPSVLAVGTVKPDFIEAAIEPLPRDGFYSLTLKVPASAPDSIFNGADEGFLEIRSDLLDDGRMYLPLHGAVVNNENHSRRVPQ